MSKTLTIRPATTEDLDAVMAIFDRARRFMAETGNPKQWAGGYPQRSLIEGDIAASRSYVVTEDDVVVGSFFYAVMDDPTYHIITDGAWLTDGPYGVIHRIASSGAAKGVLAASVSWCRERCASIRIDTHEDNRVMQGALERLGFKRCGIIFLANGDERVAYQRI
jgi:RimJ/RimL family protein N-acetyltransferase